ncbi:ead/Ea22-like family protein, partial [Escherichia coli]
MSKINYQALREAAKNATKGSYIVGHTSVNQHGNLTGVFVCQKQKGEPDGVIAEFHVNCLTKTFEKARANADFFAAFSPEVALALLDELESAKKRIAELESRTVKLPEAFRLAKSSNVLMYHYADEVNAALAAAGIRIKGEDHGNK